MHRLLVGIDRQCRRQRLVSEFSETFGLRLEFQDLGCQDQVLVSVLTEFSNQDQSWYWSCLKFYFKTSLGLGLIWNLVSREVLVLVSRGEKIKTKSRPCRVRIRNQNMYTVSSADKITSRGKGGSRVPQFFSWRLQKPNPPYNFWTEKTHCRHLPDTLQTPCRHFPEKSRHLPDKLQTSSTHLHDTFQTLIKS